MKLRVAFSVCSLFVLTAACAAPTSEPEVGTGDSELRALKANEVIGFLNYGDSKTFSYSKTPMYRAYRYRGNAFDLIDIQVTALDSGRSVEAVLTDESFKEIAKGEPVAGKPGVVAIKSENRWSFQDFYIVVRESSFDSTKVKVELKSDGVKVPAEAIDLVDGTYAAPSAFVGQDVDVAMKCVIREDKGSSLKSVWVRSEGTGVISLHFDNDGASLTGADGIPGPIQGAKLRAWGDTHSNQLLLDGDREGNWDDELPSRNTLYVTNISKNEVRVELAQFQMFPNGTSVKAKVSCVGIATP